MGNKLKERVQKTYINLRKETVNDDSLIEGGVDSLTLGCFFDNNCDITNCRSKNFQPEDSFTVKSDADIANYSEDYIITQSRIPGYIEITKKSKGECCPFYEFKCRFILDAVFKEVYGESDYRIV